MKRYLFSQILGDLKRKMVFVTGPRQVGKTYLAKQIMQEFNRPQYLNYDIIEDRRIILQRSWRLNSDLIIFDEIHKMKNWKNYLKGVYDSRPENQSILVTGSARLETYRQTGESLAGRYLHLRLNPLSVSEIKKFLSPYKAIDKLNSIGGFPEPFLAGVEDDSDYSGEFAARWRNQYFTDLIREDVLEFSRIHEINTMKQLVELLRSRVASPLSYKSLAEDLLVSPNTIKKYVQILESLFIIFLVKPYYKSISRSIQKEAKLYFFDSGYVNGDDGVRFENTCAVCLLKYVQYLYDAKGKDVSLNYLRTKDGKEIDFVIVRNKTPEKLIEVKLTNNKPSKSLISFTDYFKGVEGLQLVHNLRQEECIGSIEIVKGGKWLSELPV